MQIFSCDDKIFAAWDDNHSSEWNEYDACDASADGLSGKKEGFYFANNLMPFLIPFQLNGVTFSPKDFPRCIENDPFPCSTCEFFIPDACPLLQDHSNFELSRKGFGIYQKYVYRPKGVSEFTFEVVQGEFLLHGRPLHYQTLSKIIKSRHSYLRISDRKLYKILELNPIYFENLGEGVYRAIPGNKRDDLDGF